MLSHRVLDTLVVLHIGFLIYAYVPEVGVCDDQRLPPRRVADDQMAVSERLSTEAVFNVLSASEVVLMCSVVLIGTLRKSRDSKGPYLPSYLLVLPGLIAVGVIAVRMRHTGLLGCARGDTQCCANMMCSDLKVTTTPPPGCNRIGGYTLSEEQIYINWRNRTTYCTIPSWYIDPAPELCGGLYGAPDTHACYQYGCSAESTPKSYYGVRLLIANAILFVILSCHAQLQ